MMKYMNYKPGWWASYFIYCMIPICIYGWYLSTRRMAAEDEEVKGMKRGRLDGENLLLDQC